MVLFTGYRLIDGGTVSYIHYTVGEPVKVLRGTKLGDITKEELKAAYCYTKIVNVRKEGYRPLMREELYKYKKISLSTGSKTTTVIECPTLGKIIDFCEKNLKKGTNFLGIFEYDGSIRIFSE